MKVALLTLADHAVAADDGRIYMIGGGIDRLAASTFPAVVPHLSLAVKFLLTKADRSLEHSVQARLLSPAGNPIIAPMGLLIPAIDPTTVPEVNPGEETPYQFVYNIRDVRLETVGQYSFSVEFDSRELGPLNLHIEQSATPSLSLRNQQDTLGSQLGLGYQRFAAGDLLGAQSIFERLTQLFPHSPDAHNNYGFLLLASGHPQHALGEFQKAIEKGHLQTELVNANIGCCQFLLGDARAAYDTFTNLFKATLRSPQATLFGLGRDAMKPVFLFTQADFLALMELNAGRCAARLQLDGVPKQLASMAEIGLVTFHPQSKPVFESLLEELKQDIATARPSKATPKDRA